MRRSNCQEHGREVVEAILMLQIMHNLLKLPEELIEEIERMGDYWERRLVTERILRKKLTEIDFQDVDS